MGRFTRNVYVPHDAVTVTIKQLFIRVGYLMEDIYMKFINKNDKKLITIILTVIIFGWLAYLTFEINRIDNNLNGYIESVIKENSKKKSE